MLAAGIFLYPTFEHNFVLYAQSMGFSANFCYIKGSSIWNFHKEYQLLFTAFYYLFSKVKLYAVSTAWRALTNIILYILSISCLILRISCLTGRGFLYIHWVWPAWQSKAFDIILFHRIKSRLVDVIAELIFNVTVIVISFWQPKLQILFPKLSILWK